MSELENKIKEQEEIIKELRKKLEDRNPAFNGNLLKRVDALAYELTKKIGDAIVGVLTPDLIHTIKYKKMYLDYDSGAYSRGHWIVRFINNESEKQFKDALADYEMKKFQESLDNFSWAVTNGQ